MALLPVQNGTWIMPCLICGTLLDYEIIEDVVECSCGVKYSQEWLAEFRAPGRWRHWINAFSCACGKVNVLGDTVEIERHRCRMGPVVESNSN